jgi:hypothetical protein
MYKFNGVDITKYVNFMCANCVFYDFEYGSPCEFCANGKKITDPVTQSCDKWELSDIGCQQAYEMWKQENV